MNMRHKKAGFTLVEMLLSIALFVLVLGVVVGGVGDLAGRDALTASQRHVTSVLNEARSLAYARYLGGSWGVYLNTSGAPHTFTLFKGASYAGRDAVQDLVFTLPDYAQFVNLGLPLGSEIVFTQGTGGTLAGQFGISGGGQTATLNVNAVGLVNVVKP